MSADLWVRTLAEQALKEWFEAQPQEPFYERQLTVGLEDRFFHWITAKALRNLVATEYLQVEAVGSLPFTLRFFHLPRCEYWRRKAARKAALVSRFSEPGFTQALGDHGEMMFDVALPRGGFRPIARNTREFDGRRWTATEHNLDRIFERDGVLYGVEIKNTLPYIPRDEFVIKLALCRELKLRPLFICRMHPKSYIWEMFKEGGYGLVIKWQLYPYLASSFAEEVRLGLGLPVDSPRAIEDGTITRLVKWHEDAQAKAKAGDRSGGIPEAIPPVKGGSD